MFHLHIQNVPSARTGCSIPSRLAASSSNGLTNTWRCVLSSWWWTEKPSETCIASYGINKWKEVASCWLYSENILAMHGPMDVKFILYESYAYWTVHHLDSWIKRDQLDVTCFIISLFNAQHVSDVNTPILRSLRLVCWVISWVVLIWFDVCWCYVAVWLRWCGIRMRVEALLQPDGCINIRNMLSK